MRGGEQPETEGWSRTKVNSIRHVQRVSLLGKGEACRVSGESVTVQGLPILETDRCGCGWSGNDQKGAWDKWRARSGSRREGRAAVRAFIVAMKPGNAGGAKGRRKMKTSETVGDQTSSIAARLKRGSATTRGSGRQRTSGGHPGNGMLAQARTRWTNILLRPWFQYAINLSPRGYLINWRAGCGRPACPVRREGRGSNVPFLPLSTQAARNGVHALPIEPCERSPRPTNEPSGWVPLFADLGLTSSLADILS